MMAKLSESKVRVAAVRANATKASRELWRGLVRFNRSKAGPLNYSRDVITVRGRRGRLLGGLILQSYWRESYIELLWLSDPARAQGYGSRLLQDAERRARRRGSRLIHLNTYSFQAPGFYKKRGYRLFGSISGSPHSATRYFYVKRLGGK